MRTPLKALDKTRILSQAEVANVVADLKRRRRSLNTRQNLIVFRLSACCGLRVSEIAGLRLCDVDANTVHPRILIREASAKRWRPRIVPLWWDWETLADLDAWKQERIRSGAQLGDPLVCSQHKDTRGKTLSLRNLQHRWMVAIKVLGRDRVKRLSIHKGRHSFCFHALAAGRTITEVRDAAGHAKMTTTYVYLHSLNGDARQPRGNEKERPLRFLLPSPLAAEGLGVRGANAPEAELPDSPL
jgi:integrase